MPAFPSFTSRHWGGQKEENSMTIFEVAFVLNAIARLVSALSTFIRTIRGRRD
jgi:hypothetical protein